MQSDQAQQPDEDSPGAPRAQRWAWRSSVASFSLRILVPLALIGAAIAFGARSEPDTIPDVLSFDHLSRNHAIRPVNYAQSPPVGGDHYPVWQNCGMYDAPIQNESAVQSLEQGAVWITYRPDLPPDDVAQLHDLVRGQPYILLSPYPGLPAPVVASAWGVQLQVTSEADPRLPWFITKYRQGPQTLERDSPCAGGVGIPMLRL